MSIECGECERDLRSGHDIGCSRYNAVKGVAEVITIAAGHQVDDEIGPSLQALKMAEAAIAHIRKIDAARTLTQEPSHDH
jgi:hypothetical protein